MTIYLHNCRTVCINVSNQGTRRKKVINTMKRLDINFKFESKKKHEYPKKGCMISHLETIKKYYEEHLTSKTAPVYLLILEDDIRFARHQKQFDNIPNQWDILYLGGNIRQKYSNWNQEWINMSTIDHHAYIVNLKKPTLLKTLLEKGQIYINSKPDSDWDNDKASYSDFLRQYIHGHFKCFMMNPQLITQLNDTANLKNGIAKLEEDMKESVHGYSIPEHYFKTDEENGGCSYVMEFNDIQDVELPNISLISIVNTPRPKDFLSLAINNFENFLYPRDKMEWNILEFVDNEQDSIRSLIKGHDRINYFRISSGENDTQDDITLGEKLNYIINESNSQYIVHFDIHHQYATQSISSRVKCLMKYNYVSCLGCSTYGCYDIENQKSGIVIEDNYQLYLPSLSYKKKFWKKRKFNNTLNDWHQLVNDFTENRYQNLMTVPYETVLYNLIDTDLCSTKQYQIVEGLNFLNHWDEDIQGMISMVKARNKQSYKFTLTDEELKELEGELSDLDD